MPPPFGVCTVNGQAYVLSAPIRGQDFVVAIPLTNSHAMILLDWGNEGWKTKAGPVVKDEVLGKYSIPKIGATYDNMNMSSASFAIHGCHSAIHGAQGKFSERHRVRSWLNGYNYGCTTIPSTWLFQKLVAEHRMDDEWHWYEEKDSEFIFTEVVYRHLVTCLTFTDLMPDDHLQAFDRQA